MCCDEGKCEQCDSPKNPDDCSEEQIKKCHGDEQGHPCADK